MNKFFEVIHSIFTDLIPRISRKLGTVSVGAGETIEAVNGSISPEGKFRVVVEHLIQVKTFLN